MGISSYQLRLLVIVDNIIEHVSHVLLSIIFRSGNKFYVYMLTCKLLKKCPLYFKSPAHLSICVLDVE